jgi:hypothetical protein
MPLEAWLPIGFITPRGEHLRLVTYADKDWQIYEAQGGGQVLVVNELLASRWFSAGLLEPGALNRFTFGGNLFFEYSASLDYLLAPVTECPSPSNKNTALSFAVALKATRDIDDSSSLHDSIYIEQLSRLLPTYSISPQVTDDILLGSYLSGGVQVSTKSFRRLQTLVNWIGDSNLHDVIQRAGLETQETVIRTTEYSDEYSEDKDSQSQETKRFCLAGRPELESFINEHIVDIIQNRKRYEALGIDFPPAIILHGPPGCGKTFAVDRLIDFLGWPSYHIEASSVASPYIHETSKKVADVFHTAMKNAPSVIVIDEMEAFLADRQIGSSSSHHRVEEVSEFLRRIPEASKNDVLIVAMTNRIEMIDPAILRRGRFDHIVKVDMASQEEIRTLLVKLISELPSADDVDVNSLAKQLAGKPLSDVAFMMREGARLAALEGKDKIDQPSLVRALDITLTHTNQKDIVRRRIGFD